MKYTISPDRKTLTISVDAGERRALRRWEKETPSLSIASSDAEAEFLEGLIANSELEWINPADTGDLTSAPMLGILGEEKMHWRLLTERSAREREPGFVITGCSGGAVWRRPILERWAFMDYQVRSVLEDLRDKGEAVFVS